MGRLDSNTPAKHAGKPQIAPGGEANSEAHCAASELDDPRLAALIDRWASLPEDVQAAIARLAGLGEKLPLCSHPWGG